MAELKLALEKSEDSIGFVIQLFLLLLHLCQGTQFVVLFYFILEPNYSQLSSLHELEFKRSLIIN